MIKNRYAFPAALICLLLLGACSEPTKHTASDEVGKSLPDGKKAAIVNVEGQLFSIPSPIQTAMFIEKNGSGYNSEMLTPASKARSQTTSAEKAVVLGMMGADLGYISIFGDQDKALPYMASIQMLSDELGLRGAFDESLIERFSNNVGDRDSMLVLISDLFESGDAYLKEEKRSDIAALVLLGGWVEGLHFSCQEAKSGSEAMRRRVAEQKTALDRLIKMLTPYVGSPSIKVMMADLKELKKTYDEIDSRYTYRKPEIKAGEQTTIIKGKVIHKLADDALARITEHISSIRKQLIG